MIFGKTRQKNLFIAEVAENIERYNQMLQIMIEHANRYPDLTVAERNLLIVSFKNVFWKKKEEFRILSNAQQKELLKGQQNLQYIQELKKQVCFDVTQICDNFIQLIESRLLPHALNPYDRIYYIKLKADYLRHLSEYTFGKQSQQAIQRADKAYKMAIQISNHQIHSSHFNRLTIYLNYSVFCYEILKDIKKAIAVSKQTFNFTVPDIIDEDNYCQSATILQLIRDNLTMWTQEQEQKVKI